MATDAAQLGIFDYDVTTGDVQWDGRVRALFGVGPEEPITFDRFLVCVLPADREGLLAAVARAFDPAGDGHYATEYRVADQRDGTVRSIATTGWVSFAGGRPLRVIGTAQDVSERRAMEDELRASRAELRELAARGDAALEEEQRRIALDLHDEVGQLLGAARMYLAAVERAAGAPGPDGPALLQAALREEDRILEQADAAMRKILLRLRPVVLDRLGLEAALRQELRHVREGTGLDCELRVGPGWPAPGGEAEIALYRIAMEAIGNAARHAKAGSLRVTLGGEGRTLTLTVEDDGRGIGPLPEGHGGLGIAGMRERAARRGGTVVVAARAPRGTVVSVRLPLG